MSQKISYIEKQACSICSNGFNPKDEKDTVCIDCKIQKTILDNPNIESLMHKDQQYPTQRQREMILKFGTADQIRQLQEMTEKELAAIKETPGARFLQQIKAKDEAEKNAPEKTVSKAKARAWITNRLTSMEGGRPKEINYESVKEIFWEFFKRIVASENPEAREVIMDNDLKEVMPRFVKWLIGDYDPTDQKAFDPRKSLYIHGDLGTGKSTLALAGHYLMEYLATIHNWSTRRFKFRSMDEIYMKMYVEKDMKGLRGLDQGNYCLDEIRVEHMDYKSFGTDINIVNDLLAVRYIRWRQGEVTLLTTNIPPETLGEELNDERLHQRMRQQYTFVELNGSNKREAHEAPPIDFD
jgi:DNA replication protein DnaC